MLTLISQAQLSYPEVARALHEHPEADVVSGVIVPAELATQTFLHIFQVDQHRPFAAPGVRELVSRIDPAYVTLEYITRNRKEHAQFLKAGTDALKPVTTVRELAARSSI